MTNGLRDFNMNPEPTNCYLPEDKDILDELERAYPSGYRSMVGAEVMSALQIKATLRTRKTYQDASITQERFSWVLLIFAMVQIGIALFQFTWSVFPANDLIVKIFVFVSFIVFVIGIVWQGFRAIDKEGE